MARYVKPLPEVYAAVTKDGARLTGRRKRAARRRVANELGLRVSDSGRPLGDQMKNWGRGS